jgi:DNA-binding SARP family transcriptional activator
MSQLRQAEVGRLSFQVLGSFQALRNHERIELGPLRQQAVLLPLVLRPGQAVTIREILTGVWANVVPASGIALVRTYISRLRLILGPDMIVRCPTGYYLRLDPDQVDLIVFGQRVIEARELRRRGQLESSTAAWQKALGLWRGPPLPEIPGLFAESNRQRLINLHLSTLEEYWDTEILLGRHTELLVELSAAVRDQPLRESLIRLFMLASYRSGRRVDAIVAFEQIRLRLENELAMSPAPVLQQLYDRIRSGDPELMHPP